MEKVLEVCVIYMLIFATLELLCLKQETSSIIDDMCRKMQIHSLNPGGGGGVLPCMGHIGMCRCEGYGFQAVYSSIGYINQSV